MQSEFAWQTAQIHGRKAKKGQGEKKQGKPSRPVPSAQIMK